MNSNNALSIGCLSALAVVMVFIMSIAMTEPRYDIDRFNPARTVKMIEGHLQDGRMDLSSEQISSIARMLYPARTIHMIEHHLQDGRTDLSSEQIPSIARMLYEESRFYGIDYRLVLAIMAVESNFRSNAVADDGARGIMQIKPLLASSIAKKAGIPYQGASDLFKPENNVRFGLYHLSWLRGNFKSTSEVLLAYNVGHNRAKRLLSRDGDADSRYTRRVLGEYQRNLTSLPAT
jgi:soluble lytic murein transglycosylase